MGVDGIKFLAKPILISLPFMLDDQDRSIQNHGLRIFF